MDTSYIKMCEKAEEIQKRNWKVQPGDYYRHGKRGDIDIVRITERLIDRIRLYGIYHKWDGMNKERCIWLPRQDQLQEMAAFPINELSPPLNMLNTLHSWWLQVMPYRQLGEMISMEQLWLAFVMQEKYNKTWNGEEWQ